MLSQRINYYESSGKYIFWRSTAIGAADTDPCISKKIDTWVEVR